MNKRKKILTAIIAVIIMSVIMTGCGSGQTQPTDSTETDTPAIPETDQSEPEWAMIDIPISLMDDTYIYAEGTDFKCFAFSGSSNADVELSFMLSDETAAMLREQSPDNSYYISIGDEKTNIGTVTLNDDCTIATLKGQHTFDQMTEIATRIRGL